MGLIQFSTKLIKDFTLVGFANRCTTVYQGKQANNVFHLVPVCQQVWNVANKYWILFVVKLQRKKCLSDFDGGVHFIQCVFCKLMLLEVEEEEGQCSSYRRRMPPNVKVTLFCSCFFVLFVHCSNIRISLSPSYPPPSIHTAPRAEISSGFWKNRPLLLNHTSGIIQT